jgi:hypothetical protein
MVDPKDKVQFAEIVRSVLALYDREPTKETLQLWWAALLEYSIEEVRAGFTRFVKSADSGKFPPKPADIIRCLEGGEADRGALAWSKVLGAIGSVGCYQSVAFDDATIHAVIMDMGGWTKLCRLDGKEVEFRANEFAKRYRAYAERGGAKEFPPYLSGITETENSAQGYKSPPPMLYGDAEKAENVIRLGATQPAVRLRQASDVVMAALAHTKQITNQSNT